MKINRKSFIIVVIFGIVTFTFFFINGYRFTGIQAAKAHFAVGKDAQLLGEVNYKWGSIYLFNTPKGHQSAISEKTGFLWRAQNTFRSYENSDLVKAVGWGSHKYATVYAVEVNDDNVAYVEIGPEPDRVRKYTSEGNLLIFSWEKTIRLNDLNGIAYSKKGEKIYEYRYLKDTNSIKHEDLRWYPIILTVYK